MAETPSIQPYATEDDMVKRFGQVEIDNLKANSQEGVDITAALKDATDEMNSYIAVRYTTPLWPVPLQIKGYCCDIARYRMWDDQAIPEVYRRYQRVVKWLQEVAAGDAAIINDDGTQYEENDNYAKPAVINSRSQRFTNRRLAKMPDQPLCLSAFYFDD